MDAKLLKIIGGINFSLFLALFIHMYFYMFKVSLIFNPSIEESNSELSFFLFSMILIGTFLIGISSIFSFFLSLDYTITFESIGLSFLVFTMTLPILLLPFDLVSPFFDVILLDLIIPSLLFSTLIFLIMCKIKPYYWEQSIVRKLVLSYSTKYPDFKLDKLAILCSVDKDFAKSVVNEMIQNNEIYAEYFENTKKFAFNIKANIEEIDKLMDLFTEWETEHIGKKV